MSDSESFYHDLRSRRVPKENNTNLVSTSQLFSNLTSTPLGSPENSSGNVENIRRTIQESAQLLRDISHLVDQNTSAQNITSLLSDSFKDSLLKTNMANVYNKELADLMATNIPRFELNSSNPSLQLRSFINACENVLSLFEGNNIKEEFFRLIKFRLGYDVQERITIEKFESINQLETHLRSICHLKPNKGKLLNEIRHEKQHNNEDVSHFVERLRKLIAQGRSEYQKDPDFEREAIHTLKHSIKNELISFKLMDSDIVKFEDLAEIAINRDCELNQRSYHSLKSEEITSKEIINELVEKIKNLEIKQAASIQHIRREPRPSVKSHNKYETSNRNHRRNTDFCHFCNRPGHSINDCRSKNHHEPRRFDMNRNQSFQKMSSGRMYSPSRNIGLQSQNYHRNRDYYSNSYNNPSQNYNQYTRQSEQPVSYQPQRFQNNVNREVTPNYENSNRNYTEESVICVRCNKEGHKSNNCFEIICRTCKQLGHSQEQCPRNNGQRSVRFTDNSNQMNGTPVSGNV